METAAAEWQIARMTAFMEQEGKEKVEEIDSKAEEEYNIMVGEMVHAGRLKIKETFDKKEADVEKCRFAQTSVLMHESFLNILRAREREVSDLILEIKTRIKDSMMDQGRYTSVLVELIIQGLIMMLEKHVGMRVVKSDLELVRSLLGRSASQYESLSKRKVSLEVDTKTFLPDSAIGGIVLFARRGSIIIENTIKSRIELITHAAIPLIREGLFGINEHRAHLD